MLIFMISFVFRPKRISCVPTDLAVCNASLFQKHNLLLLLLLPDSGQRRYLSVTFVMERRANRCVNCSSVTAASPRPTSSAASDLL